jgi:hypothetical protein
MDLNELKKRLTNLNTGGKKGSDNFKPKDEHEVRLVAPADGSDPFKEVLFHYEIDGQNPVLCPKNFSKECAVCIFADTLKNWNGPDGKPKPEAERKEEWELFKRIQAKPRIFVSCLERGQEAAGVRLWSMTPNQVEQCIKVCSEADRLEAIGIDPTDSAKALSALFDHEKAFDLHVSFKKPLNADKKGNMKNITVIDIQPKFKATPLASSKKAAEELSKACPNVWEQNPEVSPEEVKRLLEKFIGSGATEAKPEGGTEKYGKAPSSSKENASKLEGTRSVDDAFSDMLNEGNAKKAEV